MRHRPPSWFGTSHAQDGRVPLLGGYQATVPPHRTVAEYRGTVAPRHRTVPKRRPTVVAASRTVGNGRGFIRKWALASAACGKLVWWTGCGVVEGGRTEGLFSVPGSHRSRSSRLALPTGLCSSTDRATDGYGHVWETGVGWGKGVDDSSLVEPECRRSEGQGHQQPQLKSLGNKPKALGMRDRQAERTG